jgi:hypothetical protein
MKPLIIIFCIGILSCTNDSQSINKELIKLEVAAKSNAPVFKFGGLKSLALMPDDGRSDIKLNLESKKKSNEPLVVHVFVPLCDNDHQGIVPTTESLGNGFSLRSNLYWATSNGMKKYFQKKPWDQIADVGFKANDTVLERVAFRRQFDDCEVILICDAYRGDMMAPCLEDYFSSLAGLSTDVLRYGKVELDLTKDVDMVVFNGHNGLMDVAIDPILKNAEERFFKRKDAVVIACASQSYFNPRFIETDSYPLLTTNSLLYPGAFILDGIIEQWANNSTEEEIKNAAGDAYHEVKDCGKQAARNMFSTGWLSN